MTSDVKRVVVTGLGAITPLGNNVSSTWKNILESKCGISRIATFDASKVECQVAGQVDFSQVAQLYPNLDSKYIEGRQSNRMGMFIQLGVVAAFEAVKDSGIDNLPESERQNIGLYLGSGIGGLGNIYDTSLRIMEGKKVNPFFIPATLINLLSGHVSILFGLQGPNLSIVTACTSGAHCIGEAARIIKCGDAKVMVAGSAESSIVEIGIKGFQACAALTTKFNDNPERASRPWDEDRSGFVMSEGAGVVVLEEYEHAKARGAKIYGEIIGYGLSGDAHHITAPSTTGTKLVMQRAFNSANVRPEDIDYINAHSTSTTIGDKSELEVVQEMFSSNKNIAMSSTKGATGHMLGAAGSVEFIFSILSMRDNVCPPTINLDNPIKEAKINLVPKVPLKKKLDTVLTNSFGFGGTNACLIIRKV
jgi:3-oxoacyl-[acyl-carrier-protein] synthase II